MNPGRFYMPNYMGMNVLPLRSPTMTFNNSLPRSAGLFSKITGSIRSVNWCGLLNNANKTLNVVNHTIPLVRQAGPMFNNMRSMLRIAKAFGTETTNKSNTNNVHHNKLPKDDNVDTSSQIILGEKKEVITDSYPNFFV